MRAFKVVLLVLFVLIGLCIAGVAIFLATFDADRYRPRVVAELQRAFGNHPVTVERLAVGWRHGLAIRLHGLTIRDTAYDVAAQPAREPLLQIDEAVALVNVWPLLRKQIEIVSVVLERPRVLVARDPQGRINLLGLAAVGSPTAASRPPGGDSETPVALRVGSLRITAGTLHWVDQMAAPPFELWAKQFEVTVKPIVVGQPMELTLTAALGGESRNISLTARLTLPVESKPGSVEHATLTVEKLRLEQVLPTAGPNEPHLEGALSAAVQGRASTLDPAQWPRGLSGTGTLRLDQPRIVDLNLLRAVFDRFSMLPGLVQLLEARLPSAYQAKLTQRDTVLSPLDLSMQLEDGWLRCERLAVRSETFELSGGGRVGWDGTLQLRTRLRIDADLSKALIAGVNELRGLANADGQMEIPLTLQGRAPTISVLPDLNYVASKLLTSTVEEAIGGWLQKALQRAAPAESPAQ